MAQKKNYGNDSISALKGADRVRKRPGVIFGSDGLEGCEHAVFEIMSNAIDEAREGHGSLITVTQLNFCSFSFQSTGQPRPWSSTWMEPSSNRVTVMREPWQIGRASCRERV